MTVYFFITGDIHSLTGGYLFNMHIINGLKQKGYTVVVLGSDLKLNDKEGLERISRAGLEKLPLGACVIVDSIVLASLHQIVNEFRGRLKFLGLMHLPVSYDISSGVHGKLDNEELKALNHMELVIVTGRFTCDLLCNAGLNRKKIMIVEPGTEHFPRKRQYKSIPSELLCIANYSAVKAQDILVRGLSMLTAWNWTMHLFGDMEREPGYTTAIRLLIQQLKMENRIFMHGIAGRHEISRIYLNADLFVMPSLFESYGMALTESLAHGIPVVTTTAGNIPDTIPAGMGLLTEPANAGQLAEAIRSLFDEPSKYFALCSAASQYYRQARSWDQAVAEFEVIIRNTIHLRPPPAGGVIP
jgi:glycosyltransferase involved in cell wall biosynthesis